MERISRVGFVRRFAFWFGVGLFALYTHGKLQVDGTPVDEARVDGAQRDRSSARAGASGHDTHPLAAVSKPIVGEMGAICARRPSDCVAASQALAVLIDRLAEPAAPEAKRRR